MDNSNSGLFAIESARVAQHIEKNEKEVTAYKMETKKRSKKWGNEGK